MSWLQITEAPDISPGDYTEEKQVHRMLFVLGETACVLKMKRNIVSGNAEGSISAEDPSSHIFVRSHGMLENL